MPPFRLSEGVLFWHLQEAYFDARRHKRSKPYVVDFERDVVANLMTLAHQLATRTYAPSPSSCFIIRDPKQREIFAADFRDRIVHHLYYNLTRQIFFPTFVADSYSCIPRRGTHYGIRRLAHHVRQATQNHTRPAYILKMDIRGYFMHIDRQRLLRFASAIITRRADPATADVPFLLYLTRQIVLLDPTEGCVRRGRQSDWVGLPTSKSLFHSPEGCGLPIGNLTSQLFSNVYLGQLDDFMKRTLHCRHYGRYVDDFYVVSPDRAHLRSLIPVVRQWLQENLGLSLHDGKTCIARATHGVDFIGAFVKPRRTYVANTTLRRMTRKIRALHALAVAGNIDPVALRDSLNSFLGVFSHHASFRIRSRLFASLPAFASYVTFDAEYKKAMLIVKC